MSQSSVDAPSSVLQQIDQRGISRSYPLYSIAQIHGAPYWAVLGMADMILRAVQVRPRDHSPTPTHQRATTHLMSTMSAEQNAALASDIMLSMNLLEEARAGRVPMS